MPIHNSRQKACPLVTSVFRPQLDGGVGPEALEVLGGQGDEVVGVLLQVTDGVVLKETENVSQH